MYEINNSIFVTYSQQEERYFKYMDKGIINRLLDNNEILTIEQHLIFSFVNNTNLDFHKSPILSDFLDKFTLQPEIDRSITNLGINDIKLLENYLELLIPKNDRKVNGAFFTPNYIVEFIIEEVSPKINDRCLDPSCGCGAFLVGLVDFFHRKYKKTIKETIKDNIFGSDILEYNVHRSKIILSLYGLLNNEIIESSDFNIYNQDSLKAEWNHKFEIIVGNPPYVKFQDLPDETRLFLLDSWKTIENGTFNLYFAFFELGHKLLTVNGKLGYITPNNYFTSLAGLSLRQYFIQNKCLTRIIDFSHKKVFDAQTYTAITFIDNKINNEILYDKVNEDQDCQEFLVNAKGSVNYLKNLDVKKWRLLKSNDQENIKIIETIGTPIKQLFNIAVGIATLKDEVFFVDSQNENDGLLEKITEKGTFYIEKEITKPVYKISNFKSQSDIKNNTLRIITPYRVDSKTAVPISEKEFQKKYPECYKYLLSEKEKLNSRDKGKSNYNPFYVWGRTQGITRFGMKILNPTFSKTPRFLFVPEKDAYFTNGYGIYFDKCVSNRNLFDDVHLMSKEENILEVQKILNSAIMEYYVAKTSVSIQGGFPCYQKNFIEKFTIPEFSKSELQVLKNLSVKEEIDEFLMKKYQIKISLPNLVS